MGIHELLVGSPSIRTLISARASVTAIREQALREGMHTLLQDGAAKLLQGHTDLRQLMRVATLD
jgi:type II secretory ATPase GspE/PulE/Tfp pilus assembly ATPase PilB-like protein